MGWVKLKNLTGDVLWESGCKTLQDNGRSQLENGKTEYDPRLVNQITIELNCSKNDAYDIWIMRKIIEEYERNENAGKTNRPEK